MRWLVSVALCGWLGTVSIGMAQPADLPTSDGPTPGVRLGTAITPKNFPASSMTDIDEAFRLAKGIGDHAVFIYQWKDLNPVIAKLMVEKSRQAGLVPIIGLSPTTLDQDRKELDLPLLVRLLAGPTPSFANPVVREAFKDAARGLARLQPPYLCLATEINFLAIHRLPEYLHFASLYKEAYQEVKRSSPGTKVFVTFQWEWVRILDAKELDKIQEHSWVIDIFRPALDLVGFTTYPSPFHGTPAELPPDYYAWMYHHISNADDVLFMEVGWPTSGTGSDAEQVAYIQQLPALLTGINVKVVAWALLHDVGVATFGADLNTVGLLTRTGERKPGYGTFRAWMDTLR